MTTDGAEPFERADSQDGGTDAQRGSANSPGPPDSEGEQPQPLGGEWPLALVLAGLVLGLVVVALTDGFRLGTVIIGAAAVLAGWMRAFLPTDRVGLLAVRSRQIDVGLYLAAGMAVVVVALVVPT